MVAVLAGRKPEFKVITSVSQLIRVNEIKI